MRLLLDTHVLYWTTGKRLELSEEARKAINSDDSMAFVSIVSLWELRIKESLRKIVLTENFYEELIPGGFDILPVTLAHIETLGHLPHLHRDPFDRMLVAQAKAEQLLLVTRDEKMMRYDVPVLKA